MNDSTWKMVSKLNVREMSALEISGNRWRTMNFLNYKTIDYPDIIIDETPIAETFDIILAEQVWEHLKYPRRGAVNCLKMLNPGGYLMITTPFLVRRHPHPTDCTRWTDEGLKYFLEDAGFPLENISVGSWGNLGAVISNLTQWVEYDRSHNAVHPLTNDPLFPIAVWALAKKA
ncbi:methyltransferase domain-containing protein [Methylobacterium dankookense]|nr:methyltransferase domain-containing protein [Methylobacterium dankookense]